MTMNEDPVGRSAKVTFSSRGLDGCSAEDTCVSSNVHCCFPSSFSPQNNPPLQRSHGFVPSAFHEERRTSSLTGSWTERDSRNVSKQPFTPFCSWINRKRTWPRKWYTKWLPDGAYDAVYYLLASEADFLSTHENLTSDGESSSSRKDSVDNTTTGCSSSPCTNSLKSIFLSRLSGFSRRVLSIPRRRVEEEIQDGSASHRETGDQKASIIREGKMLECQHYLDILPLQFRNPSTENSYAKNVNRTISQRTLICSFISVIITGIFWPTTAELLEKKLLTQGGFPLFVCFHCLWVWMLTSAIFAFVATKLPWIKNRLEMLSLIDSILSIVAVSSWSTWAVVARMLRLRNRDAVPGCYCAITASTLFVLSAYALVAVDLLKPVRGYLTFVPHIVGPLLSGFPFISGSICNTTAFPWTLTLLYIVFLYAVSMFSMMGRCISEFQQRMMFQTLLKVREQLKQAERELQASRTPCKAPSTVVEELIFLIQRCMLVVTNETNKQPSDIACSKEHHHTEVLTLLSEVMNKLTSSTNLYRVNLDLSHVSNGVARQFLHLFASQEKSWEDRNRQAEAQITASLANRSLQGVATASSLVRSETSGDDTTKTWAEGGHKGERRMREESGDFTVASPMPDISLSIARQRRIGRDVHFSLLSLSEDTENILVEVGYALLAPLVVQWDCSMDVLIHLLRRVQNCYQNTPYHNKTHGALVAHLTGVISGTTVLGSSLSCLHSALLFTSALCHDIGHPGRNNHFLIQTYDPLAIVYNDAAVLENFHCCLAFKILEE
eukprot:GHVS01057921.1.p1 GENE.GHVS01057921.1~~GHVS01057921.1.p1  ORF type:complete len:780 (-),score=55.47 GHVS01057921.1:903-3242(-)